METHEGLPALRHEKELEQEVRDESPVSDSKVEVMTQKMMETHKLSSKEAAYFVFNGSVSNLAYDQKQGGLKILYKNGKIKEVISASDHLSLKVLSKTVTKHYICFPEDIL